MPRAIAQIVEVAVHGLSIRVFDSHFNGAVRSRNAGEISDPRSKVVQMVYGTRTTCYSVQDSGDEAPSLAGLKIFHHLVLPPGKRGVIYVCTYATGEIVSELLKCLFLKA